MTSAPGTHLIRNASGLSVRLSPLGAALVEVLVPDREGRFADVLCHAKDQRYAGVTVGRVANRICRARFALEGEVYELTRNEGEHHLHGGGEQSLEKLVWDAEPSDSSVTFGVRSPDGADGYPGSLDVRVTYALAESDELVIRYHATTDRPTPVNLTNHAYWNLGGAVEEHELALHAAQCVPTDDDLIPTGAIQSVEGTALDFTSPRRLGSDPFDHTFVLEPGAPAATLSHGATGRRMQVFTTQPALQLFATRQALCLEVQGFPDAVNHPQYPSVVLQPGEQYVQETTHRFDVP
ncbi:MAG: aldose epimerase family protein [Planctomycetota bacterium]|jgi:aldose 1-epimerase|nr:galactose-1-epimerase [Candidatus Woesearchaeota archaeon]MDP6386162.1 aldose epimerase family protein [Planctomycetota bacterium]MDP6938601.1 aldose epimerase family protein [Planctomycetota bacterium]